MTNKLMEEDNCLRAIMTVAYAIVSGEWTDSTRTYSSKPGIEIVINEFEAQLP